MNRKRWMILIIGFVMIEGLILVSNKVFYEQIEEMEEISDADRSIFETQKSVVVEKKRKSAPALAGLKNDPLAPMIKKSKPEKERPASGSVEKIYETGVKSGILIQ